MKGNNQNNNFLPFLKYISFHISWYILKIIIIIIIIDIFFDEKTSKSKENMYLLSWRSEVDVIPAAISLLIIWSESKIARISIHDNSSPRYKWVPIVGCQAAPRPLALP